MNRNQMAVREFHSSFELTINEKPTIPSDKDARLRRNLITEEAEEFAEASKNGDIVEVADALADLLYVIYGAANTYGIDMDPVFDEVHRSNMSKLWSINDPCDQSMFADEITKKTVDYNKILVKRKEDGKVMKGPGYSPANVSGVLDKLSEG